jgi:hypothetical protein
MDNLHFNLQVDFGMTSLWGGNYCDVSEGAALGRYYFATINMYKYCLPFRKKQFRLEHPAGLRAQPGPVVQAVAGDPQELAAADEQWAAATLCSVDLVVDEVFFELLGAGHAQGRKPVSRPKIADHHGKFDGRHVHIGRLRAVAGKLRDRGDGHLGQADAIPGLLDRQITAAGQVVLEVVRCFIRQ